MRQTRNSSLVLVLLMALVTGGDAWAQTAPTSLTGAGQGGFPAGALLNDVSVATLRFGIGVAVPGDGTARGDMQATLIGTVAGKARRMTVEAKAVSGSIGSLGSATVSGTCALDRGDGSAPLTGLPFSLTATQGGDGKWTLGMAVGATTLPAATVSAGSITVH